MKFSIRDLLLVTMIVALAVGWGVDHWQPPTTSRIKAMLRRGGFRKDHINNIEQYTTTDGGPVVTVWTFSDEQHPSLSNSGHDAELPNPPAPAPTPAKP